jgi:hypothetical protein
VRQVSVRARGCFAENGQAAKLPPHRATSYDYPDTRKDPSSGTQFLTRDQVDTRGDLLHILHVIDNRYYTDYKAYCFCGFVVDPIRQIVGEINEPVT